MATSRNIKQKNEEAYIFVVDSLREDLNRQSQARIVHSI